MSALAISLHGKRALVTGTAMGIGKSIAATLARAGAHVLAVDIEAEAGQRNVDELREAGLSAEFVALDLRDDEGIAALAGRLADDSQALDVLVNNAGLALFKRVASMPEAYRVTSKKLEDEPTHVAALASEGEQ